MSGLRVALVHPFSWPEVRRGGERLLHDLAWYLASMGHRVEVLTGSWAGPGVTEVDGVTLRRLQLRDPEWLRRGHVGPLDSFGLLALPSLLRRRYDVVHCLTPTGVMAARAAGQRCVYTVLGHPSPADFALQPRSRTIFSAAVRAASELSALSASAADRVEEITGRRPVVLPPGVRLDHFTPAPEVPGAGAPSGEGPVSLLFASDASEVRKGVHHALAALGRVRRVHPEARLVLGGPGSPQWALRGVGDDASAVLRAKDPLAVEGLGPEGPGLLAATDQRLDVAPGDMPGLYRQSTVTLLPSWEEAFGLVLAESLACGTPVACFDEAGMREVVTGPQLGRLAPFGDDAALADAVLEAVDLARRPGTAAACAAHARKWGWQETVGPAYEDLYRQVSGRPRLFSAGVRTGPGPRLRPRG